MAQFTFQRFCKCGKIAFARSNKKWVCDDHYYEGENIIKITLKKDSRFMEFVASDKT